MHHLTDFKGFEDAQINLLRPFTLLIGPNGSGKSNVIEAIELLSFVARGQPLHEIGDVGRAPAGLQIREVFRLVAELDWVNSTWDSLPVGNREVSPRGPVMPLIFAPNHIPRFQPRN